MDTSITLTEEILLLCQTDYFVETGTFLGGCVQLAIEAGFSDIRSIEIDPVMFQKNQDRFANDTRVTLYFGDSVAHLSEMIEDINEPITFWLDAHAGNSPTTGQYPVPLLEELRIIGEHPVKDHVILIDDVRLMGKAHWAAITKERVEAAIREINPRYEIHYEGSRAAPGDILMAVVSKEAE